MRVQGGYHPTTTVKKLRDHLYSKKMADLRSADPQLLCMRDSGCMHSSPRDASPGTDHNIAIHQNLLVELNFLIQSSALIDCQLNMACR